VLSAAKLRPFLLIQKDLHEKSVNLQKIFLLSVCFEIWVWQISGRWGLFSLKALSLLDNIACRKELGCAKYKFWHTQVIVV
jgi:hypothetical protein